MDTIVITFCEAVAATVGICPETPVFANGNWTVSFQGHLSQRTDFHFHLTDVEGTWKYAFQVPNTPMVLHSSYRTMDQINALPHLNDLRVTKISLCRISETIFNVMVPFYYDLDYDVNVLLKFVLSRSQDRITNLTIKGVFEVDRDALLIDRFKDFYFEFIQIWNYRGIFNGLVRSHFSRNRWTHLDLRSDSWSVPFLRELRSHVLSPDFCSLFIERNNALRFGFEMFESIFQKFLENKWLGERKIIFKAQFEENAKDRLRNIYRSDLLINNYTDIYCWRNRSGQILEVYAGFGTNDWQVSVK
ncbi:hypothetical protein L596_010869 [Steinernema carpocapsae]|uniref:Uncharacterized protein n=1 Tax=Steinernema carpocapsae TaxID=34508 RepID=A0A4U5PJX4_STECR|nr:hypothetical protein L596_010869 [Steinernema carpocapsae]